MLLTIRTWVNMKKSMILIHIRSHGTEKSRNRIKNTMRIVFGEWREDGQNHRLFR